MAVSSAAQVKRELLVLLEAAFASEKDVHVTYGHPGPSIQQEAIYFHRTISNEVAAALGHRRRNETYTVELMVDITQDGDRYDLAEQRCWQVVGTIETVVRENASVGGEFSGFIVYRGTEVVPYWSDGQTLAEATCRIEIVNRK